MEGGGGGSMDDYYEMLKEYAQNCYKIYSLKKARSKNLYIYRTIQERKFNATASHLYLTMMIS